MVRTIAVAAVLGLAALGSTRGADDAELMARMGFKPQEVAAQRERDVRDAADGKKAARERAQRAASAALPKRHSKTPSTALRQSVSLSSE
jgi:hypothetical protein